MGAGLSSLRLPAAGLLLALGPYVFAAWNSPAFGTLGDQPIHLALSADFAEALANGEIPPSWSDTLSGGRGGPAFVLYPPLFFLLTAVCSLLTPSMEAALGLALAASVAWVFAGVYWLARAELSAKRSTLAATLVPLLPGVVFLGWGRGLLPNFLALGWIAFLLGAGVRAIRGGDRRRSLAALSLCAAGLVLTHALSTVMAGALVAVCLPAVAGRMGFRGFAAGVIAAATAAAATVWFWLPMLATTAHAQTSYLADLHPYARSLLFGPSGDADGFSEAWADLNDFGLAIGGVQLFLAAVALFAVRGTDKTLAGRTLPWVAGFVLLASVYPTGAWLAETPGFSFLQFAWRWQGPFAVWCAVAMASAPRERLKVPAALFALVAAFFLPMFTPASVEAARRSDIPDRPLTPEEYAEVEPAPRALYVTNLIEMRPAGADRLRYPPGPSPAVEVLSGAAEVVSPPSGQARREYRVRVSEPAVLRLPVYAFPGWTADWNGRPVAVRRDGETALQLVELPVGEGTLTLRFSRWNAVFGD